MENCKNIELEIIEEIEYYNSLPIMFNNFVDTSNLSNNEIELKLVKTDEADFVKKWVPGYYFDICKNDEKIGFLNLRIGYTEGLYYGGQIGYEISSEYRGNGYAVDACRLLIPVMKAHNMEKVLITNAPDNTASQRVCEKLGAKFIRTAKLPIGHDLYNTDLREYSNIFEWTL